MRILVLTTDAFGGYGGIAQYNRDLLTALCEIPEVAEVTAIPRTLPLPAGKLPLKLNYITQGAGGKLRYVGFALRAIFRKPDLIICGHIRLLGLCVLIKKIVKAPLVLMTYGLEVWRKPTTLFHLRFLENIDQIWSISQFTRNRMQTWSRIPESSFRIIPNAIHLGKYGIRAKDIDLSHRLGLKDKKVIMMMGRLATIERWKGIDEVLDIMPRLLLKQPNVALVVVGDGDDRSRLEEKAARLGLSKDVTFTGYVSEEHKSTFLNLADAFVMPTRVEGFGFVFLEALASGIPVVASKIDGSREAVMNGKLGRLVDPDNSNELEAEILSALNDPHQIPSAIEYFSFDNFKIRVSKVMRDLSPH